MHYSLFTSVSHSYERMWAISLRHLRQMYKDVSRLIHVFYWPFLDIMLWGFTAQWVQQRYTDDARFSLTMLAAIVAWQLFVRANLDVSTHLLEDIQDQNIVNLFASPLTLFEWAGGILLLTFANVAALMLFCSSTVFLLYHLNIAAVGLAVMPFIFNLMLGGLAVGFLGAGLLIYWGRRTLGIIYMLGWFFAPFSGAFYPITILPIGLRLIAQILPIHYTIEGIRQLVSVGTFSYHLLGISFVLSVLYCVLGFTFFVCMFACSKQKGLARLAD